MATLQAADIDDLVIGTLRHLGKGSFQQIAQELQDYEVMSRWLKTDRVVFDSGYGISRTLMDQTIGAASHRGLYEEDNPNVGDHLVQLTVDYVHADTYWVFDHREVLMNTGAQQIVDLVKVRRAGAMIDLAQELEERAWAAPAETGETEYPYGIPYWVTYNGYSSGGFEGAQPYGYTADSVGGVDLSDHPNFKNYVNNYTNVTKDDLIKKMRTAHRKIRFKSPVSINDFRNGKGDRYRIYVDETTISAMEDLVSAQNDNLGIDLAKYDGQATFRRHPIVWVPYLDDNMASGSHPVYMIDHSVFHPAILKGNYLRQTGPQQSPKQHNMREVWIDLSYNYVCVDRRRCAVLAISEPMA